jgi:hypothetical protein
MPPPSSDPSSLLHIFVAFLSHFGRIPGQYLKLNDACIRRCVVWGAHSPFKWTDKVEACITSIMTTQYFSVIHSCTPSLCQYIFKQHRNCLMEGPFLSVIVPLPVSNLCSKVMASVHGILTLIWRIASSARHTNCNITITTLQRSGQCTVPEQDRYMYVSRQKRMKRPKWVSQSSGAFFYLSRIGC